MSSLDWLHNTELISQHVHEAIEATIFPSLSILFLGGEQDGLSKTLLVVSFDKSYVFKVTEFYFYTWIWYPDTCPTEIPIKGLEKFKHEEC